MNFETEIIKRVRKALPNIKIKQVRTVVELDSAAYLAIDRVRKVSTKFGIYPPPTMTSGQITMMADETVMGIKWKLEQLKMQNVKPKGKL